MKIIHTSDWHLGQSFYNHSRTDEDADFLRQLGDIMDKERPDALLISGDVFHTGTPGNDVSRMFVDLLLEIQARSPSTEVFAIAGNHDSYSRLEVDRSLWARHHVTIVGTPAEKDDGTADFEKNVFPLQSGKGTIVAIPFCSPRNFPRVAGAENEDLEKAYFSELAQFVRFRKDVDGLPTVLMAHMTVGQDTDITGNARPNVVGGEERVDPAIFGSVYDYVALGHIHCPQWVKADRKVVRYSGSPIAVHFDETYSHTVSVVEVETGKDPILREIQIKPLRPLVTIGKPDGKPFEAILQELNSDDLNLSVGTYIRCMVSVQANEAMADWVQQVNSVCVQKGWRYCKLEVVRPEISLPETPAKVRTVSEIRDLSNDEILGVLNEMHPLTDLQKELISGLLTEMDDEARA